MSDDGFLTRWSRRKAQVQRGGVTAPDAPADEGASADVGLATATAAAPDLAPPAQPSAVAPGPAADAVPATSPQRPPPTLEDARSLTPDADFSRYVQRDVDPEVRNTALKSLFSDPHYQVMDGLDTYIDDYGRPDPLPPGMLRQLAQSAALGLFCDRPEEGQPDANGASGDVPPAPTTAVATAPTTSAPAPLPLPDSPCDEDTDLRLQPNDDARCAGLEPGVVEDPRREH